MKKFKIAVWVDKEASPHNGGSYTYPAALISNIDRYNFDPRLEVIFTGFLQNSKFEKPYLSLQSDESYLSRKLTNFLHKFFRIKFDLTQKFKSSRKSKNLKFLAEQGVEMIFYPVNYIHYDNFPFMVNNWDIGHASTYAFEEFVNTIEDRITYFHAFDKALFICADSEAGKKELTFHLNLFSKKIKVLPFFPANFIEETTLPIQPGFIGDNDQYFFYPAALGAHKNHYGLIMAFHLFHAKNPHVKLVFTGNDYKNKYYLKDLVTSLNLENHVIFAGFIDDSTIKWLYMNALGLVMPTYLGPTNMPLLEAQALKCRVACSNLAGHRELLGDYALYFEPESIDEIYNCLLQLYALAEEPVTENSSSYTIENTLIALNQIFIDAINVRRTWGLK